LLLGIGDNREPTFEQTEWIGSSPCMHNLTTDFVTSRCDSRSGFEL